jgi:hypothetical protein
MTDFCGVMGIGDLPGWKEDAAFAVMDGRFV